MGIESRDGAARELRAPHRDRSRWEEAGRAHGEVFRHIQPATTFVGAAGFLDPAILVEIEATAIAER